ncbi:MAG TPA: hypothetical protein VD995_06070 [Azospirillum sp.]|nr:hypothetical protein [Azospirillum sp.]
MQDVFGISCPPLGNERNGRAGAEAVRRAPGYVAPALAATFFAALALHLLVEVAWRIDPADPAGLLSVAMGGAVVVVTLVPFAMLFAARARAAWRRVETAAGERPGSALLPH